MHLIRASTGPQSQATPPVSTFAWYLLIQINLLGFNLYSFFYFYLYFYFYSFFYFYFYSLSYFYFYFYFHSFLQQLTIPTALSAFLHCSAFSGLNHHSRPSRQSQPTDASYWSGRSVGFLGKIVGTGGFWGKKSGTWWIFGQNSGHYWNWSCVQPNNSLASPHQQLSSRVVTQKHRNRQSSSCKFLY